jgi:hypothetical protein
VGNFSDRHHCQKVCIYNLGFLRILTGQDPEKVETKEVHINEYGTDDYSRLALTLLMYDTRMSWGMKFAGEV